MSSSNAIAVCTQTLIHVVHDAIKHISGAHVTQLRPEDQAASAQEVPRVNLYLVQARLDPFTRSSDLPTRDDRGRLVAVPRVELNLRYMLSFFGPPPAPHLMLGATEIALHTNAIFSPELVRRAVAHQRGLSNSGLDRQQPPVQIVPASLTLEEMSRFWSGFFQVPYTLSTFYDATSVQIEAPVPITAALPVAQTRTGTPQQPPPPDTPIGNALGPQLGPFGTAPVMPGALLRVTGANLVAGMALGFGGVWVKIDDQPHDGLMVTVPSDMPPGAHEVRLGAAAPGGDPVPVAGSPTQTLAVRPVPSHPLVREDAGNQTIVVTIDPAPDPKTQTLAVDLVALSGTGWSIRVSGGVASPSEPDVFTFGVPIVKGIRPIPPGEYVVIVEVDGIPSLPGMVGGRYREPEVTVS